MVESENCRRNTLCGKPTAAGVETLGGPEYRRDAAIGLEEDLRRQVLEMEQECNEADLANRPGFDWSAASVSEGVTEKSIFSFSLNGDIWSESELDLQLIRCHEKGRRKREMGRCACRLLL